MQESAEACGECYSELQGESSSFLWIVGYLGPLQSCAPDGCPAGGEWVNGGSAIHSPSNHILGLLSSRSPYMKTYAFPHPPYSATPLYASSFVRTPRALTLALASPLIVHGYTRVYVLRPAAPQA